MTWKNTFEEEEEKLAKDAAAVLPEKPVWESGYAHRIDSLMEDLENRPDFSYDADSDPLYRQYESRYRREGERAMEDTLAAAASHAGGMNSYAVTAAQQAEDYYNAQLLDVLPELAQLAYERYRTDYEEDLNALERLQDREAEAYSRYQDDLAAWRKDLADAYALWEASQQDGAGVDAAPADPYAGTDYYQDAINAAVRGDRATAEAALSKRGEKMTSPNYHGTGGGTSMEAARQYIEGLLASSEDADISERDASGMLGKAAWKESRAAGIGPEASYSTYEDYVSDYLRYLMREGV